MTEDRRKEDIRIEAIKTDVSEMKVEISRLNVILTERCAQHEMRFQASITATNATVATAVKSVEDFCKAQKGINKDYEKRIASLERARAVLYGAAFICGLLLGKVLPPLSTIVP